MIGLDVNLSIYKMRGDKAGPALTQYRDCIDVAVKLAFALDETKENMQFDPDPVKAQTQMKTLAAAKLISNNTVFDSKFTQEWGQARIKQSSDMKIVDLFAKIEAGIDQKIQKISKCLGAIVSGKVKPKGFKPINDTYDPKKSLQTIETELDTYVKDLDNKAELQVVCGEVINDNF